MEIGLRLSERTGRTTAPLPVYAPHRYTRLPSYSTVTARQDGGNLENALARADARLGRARILRCPAGVPVRQRVTRYYTNTPGENGQRPALRTRAARAARASFARGRAASEA